VAVMPISGVIWLQLVSPAGTVVTPGPRKLTCQSGVEFAPLLLSASKA
jgi:hypothetical protein